MVFSETATLQSVRRWGETIYGQCGLSELEKATGIMFWDEFCPSSTNLERQ